MISSHPCSRTGTPSFIDQRTQSGKPPVRDFVPRRGACAVQARWEREPRSGKHLQLRGGELAAQ
jgi:hypothetical protein